MKEIDHVLLVGFGSPRAMGEVIPFLRGIARVREIPEERLGAVQSHYRAIGGFSPYTRDVYRLKERLEELLSGAGLCREVFVGMRFWHPYLDEVFSEIHERGLAEGLAIVLAPHRSEASYDRYVEGVDGAQRKARTRIRYRYAAAWHTDPLFIRSHVRKIRRVLEKTETSEREGSFLIFSAHSIPEDMRGARDYERRCLESCRAVAAEAGFAAWALGYQSRGGRPEEKWLEPDVASLLPRIHEQGFKRVLVVPIGFLFENAEILYDLDIRLCEEAERLGLHFIRVGAVSDENDFLLLLKGLVQRNLWVAASSG